MGSEMCIRDSSLLEHIKKEHLFCPIDLLDVPWFISLLGEMIDPDERSIHANAHQVSEIQTLRGSSLLDWGIFDIAKAVSRLRCDAEAQFQKTLLRRHVNLHGLQAMPKSIRHLYTTQNLSALQLRKTPIEFVTDLLVLNRLRNHATGAAK